MDPEQEQPRSQSGTVPDRAEPHLERVDSTTGIGARSTSRRLRLGVGATLRGDDFSNQGVEQAGERIGTVDRDQVEELIFSVMRMGQEKEAQGEQPDFLLLTEEVAIDEPGMEPGAEEPAAPRGVPNRYDIIESIGHGANGQVFAVFDNNLKREVATKFLHPDRAKKPEAFARFVREAQVTASLAHPNILPIYDVDVSDAGLPYFTMRKAEGSPLSDLIDRARGGNVPKEIADWFDRAAIMGKVCDAMAYAHNVGVIHQDIKPENIILGRFGQVLLIDWGTAVTAEEIAAGSYMLQGTPAYMAPEQARKDDIDERSDIYAIGASLFQLLTLRLPTWADDVDSFWEKKRSGVIEGPRPEERRAIPGPLLAIAMKAMAADPDERYQHIEELREDLRRYQSGESVAAYRESVTEIVRRVYHRYTAACWVGLVVGCLLMISLGFYWWEKQKEYTTWHVAVAEDFSQTTMDDLAGDWHAIFASYWSPDHVGDLDMTVQERWSIQDGALCFKPGRGAGCHNLTYRHPLPGNVRISYDITAANTAHNLNCYIAGTNRFNGYTVHIGGWGDGSRIDITRGTNSSRMRTLDRRFLDEPLAVGRTYHVMVEWADGRLSLWLDQALIIEVEDYAPLAGTENQYFGFELAEASVRIDNLLVERQPLPQKVSALAVADGLMAEGALPQAIAMYRGIITSIDSAELEAVAGYRIARCLVEEGQLMQARAALHAFLIDHPAHSLRHSARALLIDCLLELGRVAEAEDMMGVIADDPESQASHKRMIIDRYTRASLRSLRKAQPGWDQQEAVAREVLRRYRHWEARFAVHIPTLSAVQEVLFWLVRIGLADEVADDFADQPVAAANALAVMGRYQEILDRYGHNLVLRTKANMGLGRYEAIIADTPGINGEVFEAYRALGRLDELLEREDLTDSARLEALRTLGQYEAVLAEAPDDVGALVGLGRAGEVELEVSERWIDTITNEAHEFALLVSGRVAEVYPYARDHWVDRRRSHQQAYTMEALRLIEAGQLDEAMRVLDRFDGLGHSVCWLELNAFIISPALRHLAVDDRAGLEATWAAMRADPRMAYSGATTAITAILDDQPFTHYRGQVMLLAAMVDGLRHEWAGRLPEAIAAYRAQVAALPVYDNVAGRAFAAWRLRVLEAAP